MAEDYVEISIPRKWIVGFWAAGAVVGFGAAFAIGPLVAWLLDAAGGAPAPLRLAAWLPLIWAIPALTIVGLCVGVWVAWGWQKENGLIRVARSGVTVLRSEYSRHVDRTRIDSVFTDGDDLVMTDGRTHELLRIKTDGVLISRLKLAFKEYCYPWQGTADPYEDDYVTWIDGDGQLEECAEELMRTRQRARADKRAGAAEDARDDLQHLGVVVRDRKETQQYRFALRR